MAGVRSSLRTGVRAALRPMAQGEASPPFQGQTQILPQQPETGVMRPFKYAIFVYLYLCLKHPKCNNDFRSIVLGRAVTMQGGLGISKGRTRE